MSQRIDRRQELRQKFIDEAESKIAQKEAEVKKIIDQQIAAVDEKEKADRARFQSEKEALAVEKTNKIGNTEGLLIGGIVLFFVSFLFLIPLPAIGLILFFTSIVMIVMGIKRKRANKKAFRSEEYVAQENAVFDTAPYEKSRREIRAKYTGAGSVFDQERMQLRDDARKTGEEAVREYDRSVKTFTNQVINSEIDLSDLYDAVLQLADEQVKAQKNADTIGAKSSYAAKIEMEVEESGVRFYDSASRNTTEKAYSFREHHLENLAGMIQQEGLAGAISQQLKAYGDRKYPGESYGLTVNTAGETVSLLFAFGSEKAGLQSWGEAPKTDWDVPASSSDETAGKPEVRSW